MGEEYVLADLGVLLLMHRRMRLNGWRGWFAQTLERQRVAGILCQISPVCERAPGISWFI